MDELTQKISEFLLTNPNSSARNEGKEVGFSKNEVNSCLYANEGVHFLKEGLTPPLWRNADDFSHKLPLFELFGTRQVADVLSAIDHFGRGRYSEMGDALEVAIETVPIAFVVGTILRPKARPNQLLIQE